LPRGEGKGGCKTLEERIRHVSRAQNQQRKRGGTRGGGIRRKTFRKYASST